MNHRLRVPAALVLAAAFALLTWSGVVVGLRAFETHPDSQPMVYLTAAGAYIALGVICGVGSVLLLRWRR